LVSLSLVANFVLMPLAALGLAKLLRLDGPLGIGLLLLGTAAGAPFLPKLAQVAEGNLAFAVGLARAVIPSRNRSAPSKSPYPMAQRCADFGILPPASSNRFLSTSSRECCPADQAIADIHPRWRAVFYLSVLKKECSSRRISVGSLVERKRHGRIKARINRTADCRQRERALPRNRRSTASAASDRPKSTRDVMGLADGTDF
jgi:hypothetical protein